MRKLAISVIVIFAFLIGCVHQAQPTQPIIPTPQPADTTLPSQGNTETSTGEQPELKESYQYHDYYPIILSLSDDKGNVIKSSLNNHYLGPYGSSLTGTSLKVGDRISWTIEAKDPNGRQLYYRWNSNSQYFDDLLGYKWSASNHLEYKITTEDLQSAGENFRIVGEIKSEKEFLRSPGSEHDDAAFLDYKLVQ